MERDTACTHGTRVMTSGLALFLSVCRSVVFHVSLALVEDDPISGLSLPVELVEVVCLGVFPVLLLLLAGSCPLLQTHCVEVMHGLS